MELTPEKARSIVWEEEEGWEGITNEQTTGSSRWSVYKERVFKHDGTFYKFHWSEGATESQNEMAFEYDDDIIKPTEVHLVEKTIVVYEPIE